MYATGNGQLKNQRKKIPGNATLTFRGIYQ